MSDESFEIRDIGPYDSLVQAMRQFANWSHHIPQPHVTGPGMLLDEAALMTRVSVTEFEREYLVKYGLDPIAATIVHGLMVRAFLSGQERAQ